MTDEEIEKISDEEIQSICYGLNLASLVGGSDFVQTLIPKKDILKLLRYINKQEKAIDRMAKELSNYAIESDTCSKWCKLSKCNKWSNGYCIENDFKCIKEYFMEDKE